MLVRLNKIILTIFISIITTSSLADSQHSHGANSNYLKTDWSFEGIFGTFERDSLQRGYQVYQEVCSGCHSVQHLSYRNLSEEGGPEFSIEEAKAIASQFEMEDGPNSDGEMFIVPAGVTVMIDEGASFRMRRSIVDVGSSSPQAGDSRAGASLQVLGVPNKPVQFSSTDRQFDASAGPAPLRSRGHWGGLVFRADSDWQGDVGREVLRPFLNTVNGSIISYGGTTNMVSVIYLVI